MLVVFLCSLSLTQILSSPDVHVHVVLPDAVEVRLVDHEQAARDHWGLDGQRGIQLAELALLRGEERGRERRESQFPDIRDFGKPICPKVSLVSTHVKK